jgi:hypothetical protein
MTRTWPSGSGIESAPKAPHPAHHCPCPRCRRHRQLELEALVEDDLLDPEIAGEATPTKVPTPGRYYEIQHGKGGLLTTAGRAYGVGSGPERLAHAKAINDHPNNRKFWVNPSNDYERQHFRAGIIDFRPQFRCDREQKRASSNEKKCFARIYIPPIGRPSGPRPVEDGGCGVPQRSELESFELELDITELEHETQPATVRPRLCFFQNHSRRSHRNHFQCGAGRQSRHIGAIESPAIGTCRRRVGPTPYDTGAEIIAAIQAARQCLGRRAVDDVHVFSHSGSSGIYGTTAGSAGLYEAGYRWVDRRAGGRTVTDVPTAALANNVRFVLHGCNTAAGTGNVARSLYRHLAASLTNPRVFGHPNSGCAGRNSNWREYSNRHPAGRSLRSLPDIVSNQPSGGRRGCCGGS